MRGPEELALRLVVAALLPLALILPLRLLYFRDEDPMTIVLLGPALEESLKFAGVLVALTVVALGLSRARDPERVLPTWLFLAPWIVGGAFGLVEGVLIYPGEGAPDFTLREVAHATFAALGFASSLWVWRVLDAPYKGVVVGLGAGLAAHILYNELGLLSNLVDITFLDQVLYISLPLILAALVLRHEVGQGSSVLGMRLFLPPAERHVHP